MPRDFYSSNQLLLHRAETATIGLQLHLVSGQFASMNAGSLQPSTQGA